MKRIFLFIGCLILVIVAHDSLLVLGMTGYLSCPGKRITSEIKDGQLLNLHQGVAIDVPFVLYIPTNEVVAQAVSNGLAVAADGNVYVKLTIGGYTRRFFSVFPNYQWICLTELVGVVNPKSLNLDENVRRKHALAISYLEQYAYTVNILRHDGSWGYGGLRRLEIVRDLIQDTAPL